MRRVVVGCASLLAVLLFVGATVVFTPSLSVPSPTTLYSEATVELSGFNPLYGYVYGNNCVPGPSGCFAGGTDYSQVPVLSSDATQPLGIYYVNNQSSFMEYSLPTQSLRSVAKVTLLYQTWATYGGMLANEFFLPYGYDEALFFGTTTSSAEYVSIETVNLTTGSVHLLNTSLLTAGYNQQPILIANDEVLVVSSSGSITCSDCAATITGFDLDNDTSWAAGAAPFFEANNIYWLPQKHQLINVEAHGATGDRVEQWNESFNSKGEPVFSLATTITVDSSITVNGVTGIGYNASSDQIAYSAGGLGTTVTYVLSYDAEGLLTTANEIRYVSLLNGAPRTAQVFNGQQYVYTSNYVMGGFLNGTQYLFDPWNGSTVPTNEPFTNLTPVVCDASCFLGTYAPSPSYLIDFHASLARNDPFWSVVFAYSAPYSCVCQGEASF